MNIKRNTKESPVWGICTKESETIIHLFATCEKVFDLWQNIIQRNERKTDT